ncbi:MAG: peptidylprolyl isomerase, partial [Candidatus Latescibacteria bacterium]|nr:peptidylprolyl isomerase [Candidatus Latescibacterota bacterium]
PYPSLNDKYTIFGQVTEGQEVVNKIGGVQRGPGDKPTTPVVLTKVTIERVK